MNKGNVVFISAFETASILPGSNMPPPRRWALRVRFSRDPFRAGKRLANDCCIPNNIRIPCRLEKYAGLVRAAVNP